MSSLIEVNSLSKQFSDKLALNKVSFEINKGKPVALVGPNGAGKTTLFSILCGFLKPTSGEVKLFGENINKQNYLCRLGALPQDAQFDPRFAIGKQLAFYAQLQGCSRKRANIETQRVLELVELSDAINVKPTELSHGMRKRVAIGQALIGSPELVMLDEATAGLDPLHARQVRELVASLSSEVTFILSSHDLSELERLCDRVLFLEDGCLQHHQRNNNASNIQYLTLRMQQHSEQIISLLQQINRVTQVIKSQDKEYVISYLRDDTSTPIEMDVLQLCIQHKLPYYQITNGKTLENQLFS